MLPDFDGYYDPEIGLQPPPLGLTLAVLAFAASVVGVLALTIFH